MGGSTAKYNKPEWLGKKYNSLTVVGFEHRGKCWFWKCECDCGDVHGYLPSKVISGHTKSCGCKKLERCKLMTEKYRIKHGGRHERLYHIWRGMKLRCHNESNKDYHNYGARGVSVFDEWKNDYAAFRKWSLENGYKENLTIDRIDPNGNYEPNNCRWVDYKTQARNKRDTIYYTVDGETKPLKTWCEIYGNPYGAVYHRIHYYGWDVERAIKQEVRGSK